MPRLLSAPVLDSLGQAADAAAARTALGLGALATKTTAGYADLAATIGGRNLLANSSFEQGLTGWTPSVATATVSSTQALVGVTSVKLTTAAPNWNVRLTANVAVKPLTTYTVSAWLYVESIAGDAYLGRDLMVVDAGDSNNWVVGSSLTTGHQTGVWTRKTVRITTSAASTSVAVHLYCPNGTVYWDCVQVEEGDVPTAWKPYTNDATMARLEVGLGAMATRDTVAATDLSCLVGGRNLVPNSSFEQALAGWINNGLSEMVVSGTQKFIGTQSLKLSCSTAGGGTRAQLAVTVKASTAYTISAWLYVGSITAAAENDYGLYVIDSAGRTAADTSLNTSHPVGVWTRKVVRITTGGIGTTLAVRLYCPQGTVYWDCVQAEEGDVPTAWRPHPSEVTDPVLINTPQLINLKAAADDAAAATAGVPVGGMYQAAGVLRVRLS